MKTVCERLRDDAKSRKRSVPADLVTVANNFLQLRQDRENADYQTNLDWTAAQAEDVVTRAAEAYIAWEQVREHFEAEDFLLHMLVPKLRN